jgi:hypothetical protein
MHSLSLADNPQHTVDTSWQEQSFRRTSWMEAGVNLVAIKGSYLGAVGVSAEAKPEGAQRTKSHTPYCPCGEQLELRAQGG